MSRLWKGIGAAYDLLWVRGLGKMLSMVLIGPILVYQRLISPVLPPSCKYHPSCSHYAVDSLWVHGPFKGLALGTARLGRCNPWSGGGVDPVPSRGKWLPDVFTDGRPRTEQVRPTVTPAHTTAPTTFPGA